MIALANKYIEKENVDALILACTELPLAIKPEDVNVPIVNTTQVHINAIYQYISNNDQTYRFLLNNGQYGNR